MADDEDLRALERDVVEPIARSILREDELDSVRVYRHDGDAPDEIWVAVTAKGESFVGPLSSPSWEVPQGPGELADRLADHLEDWVCETRFAWGEQREANRDATRRSGA